MLRARALDVLSAVASARALATPRVHFLCLHHVEPEERDGFRSLLEFLVAGHELISYSEGVRRVETAEFVRPAVAISFDDGFRSCLAAADILEDFGARACFFVCPGFVGASGEAARAICAARFDMPAMEFLSWEDLAALRDRGHEIGGHTLEHDRVSGLTPARFAIDLDRSAAAFAERGLATAHFAWPFGGAADFGDPYVRLVREAGIELRLVAPWRPRSARGRRVPLSRERGGRLAGAPRPLLHGAGRRAPQLSRGRGERVRPNQRASSISGRLPITASRAPVTSSLGRRRASSTASTA